MLTMNDGKGYALRTVIFDTIAPCEELILRLQKEGIKTSRIVFGLHAEKSLRGLLSILKTEAEECLLITNNKLHAKVAEACSVFCVGCVEGNFEIPKVNTLLESPEEVSASYLNMIFCHEKRIPAVILQTSHCIIRELTVQDAGKLYEICSKPQVNRYLEESVGSAEEEKEKLCAYVNTAYAFYGYGFWGVYEKQNGKLIGKAGFKEGSLPLEIGYLLDNTVWGKGYATEIVRALVDYASEELNVQDIVARIHHENFASQCVAKKCGVRIEEVV